MMNEIAKKYGLCSLEEALENWENINPSEIKVEWYRTFLQITDHIPNKMVEAFFETLASLTVTNFLTETMRFVNSTYKEYKPILNARHTCRLEINKFEKEV